MRFERENSAGYMTNWAARLFARAIDRRLKRLGMSSGQLPVFFALADGGSLTQKELARAAAIEQPTMAGTLTRMERDGLIERRTDLRDRRSAKVSLTPAALRKAQLVLEAVRAVNEEALAELSETERESFVATLRTVVVALERSAES